MDERLGVIHQTLDEDREQGAGHGEKDDADSLGQSREEADTCSTPQCEETR